MIYCEMLPAKQTIGPSDFALYTDQERLKVFGELRSETCYFLAVRHTYFMVTGVTNVQLRTQ